MSSTTPNLGLTKTTAAETIGQNWAASNDSGGNFDIIDTKMGPVGNQSVQAQLNALNSKMTNMEAFSVVNFTPETGITNDLFIRRFGRVVVINGYLTGTSALANNQLLGTIETGNRPIAPIRLIGGVADAAYQVGDVAYVNVGTNGEIRVTTKSGNTYKTLYFSCSYIVQS